MNYIDIIILVIIIASAVEGSIRGFIFEICVLIGLAAGFFIARAYFVEVAEMLDFITISDWILRVISFLLIVIIVSTLFRYTGKILRGLLKKIFMGWADHLAGAVFGIVRGCIVVMLITLVLLLTPVKKFIRREAPDTRLLKQSVEWVDPFLGYIKGETPRFPGAI